MKRDYSKEDIIRCLCDIGISEGDNIFIHSNLGFFGRLEGAIDKNDYYLIFKEAIFEVIKKEGTLVMPTFSYSFCWGQIFDKEETPGITGVLSEMMRIDPQSIRSDDANFSIVAIGKNARYFTEDAPEYSFGTRSFWDKFLQANGKICNFNFDAASTFIHYVERVLQVPYRHDKPFWGTFRTKGMEEKRVYYHFVYELEKPENVAEFTKFDILAKKKGVARTVDLGKGQIVLISAKDSFELIKEELKLNPFFLTAGGCRGKN